MASARLILIGAVALIVVLLIVAFSYWSDERVVKRRHEALVVALEKRSQKRLLRVMSENYGDRWGFSNEDAALAMKDAGSHFLVFVVNADDPVFDFQDDRATVTVYLRVGGKALSGIGREVMSRANKMKTPWIFTWEKEGFGPGSWRLVSMENESIPDDAYGYKPGDLQRALRGEGF